MRYYFVPSQALIYLQANFNWKVKSKKPATAIPMHKANAMHSLDICSVCFRSSSCEQQNNKETATEKGKGLKRSDKIIGKWLPKRPKTLFVDSSQTDLMPCCSGQKAIVCTFLWVPKMKATFRLRKVLLLLHFQSQCFVSPMRAKRKVL